MGQADKVLLVMLVPAVIFLLAVWWQQRYWFAESLVLSDQPREVLRGVIAVAVARWGESRPGTFRVESETPDGVVLRAGLGWRPGFWQRITVEAQEGSIRIVSEATFPAGSGGRENLEAIRARVVRSIDWARGRTPEEILQEGRRGPLAGPA